MARGKKNAPILQDPTGYASMSREQLEAIRDGKETTDDAYYAVMSELKRRDGDNLNSVMSEVRKRDNITRATKLIRSASDLVSASYDADYGKIEKPLEPLDVSGMDDAQLEEWSAGKVVKIPSTLSAEPFVIALLNTPEATAFAERYMAAYKASNEYAQSVKANMEAARAELERRRAEREAVDRVRRERMEYLRDNLEDIVGTLDGRISELERNAAAGESSQQGAE